MRSHRVGRYVAVALAAPGIGWFPSAPAIAQAQSVIEACWTSPALTATRQEKAPRHGDRRFDAAPMQGTLAPFAPLPATAKGAIRRVALATDRKLIALTFDLCEQPGEIAGYDGAIVDYLRRERVKATFFAGGKWLRSHEERARQLMADPLFEIANHAEAHRNLRRLDEARLTNEILGPQRAYEAIRRRLSDTQCAKLAPDAMSRIAPRLTLFRFPYGACNDRSLQAVHDHGLRAIQWDLSTGDPWPSQSARAIVRTLLAHARPGSIILAHANGRGWHTAAALPVAIPKLRSMGFEFVTVSELLEAGTPVVSKTCFDSRPGDTDRFDHFAPRRRPSVPPSTGLWFW
jgi:peptidoglycan/xylan/chitin deacetylase (PgdA/CDA1 family)